MIVMFTASSYPYFFGSHCSAMLMGVMSLLTSGIVFEKLHSLPESLQNIVNGIGAIEHRAFCSSAFHASFLVVST